MKWLVPEVVQSSTMDCGPATLKALFEGFGMSMSYGRLREACQTDVDGTSIDTMEEVTRQLGLDAEPILIPAEHLLLPEARALPAIVVVRLSTGMTHFVLVWRAHGRFIQVMDPRVGRQFVRRQCLLQDLYQHVMPVPATVWREWAGSDDGRRALERRLSVLGAPDSLIESALEDPGVVPAAALEAGIRAVESMVGSNAVTPGRRAADILTRLFESAVREPERAFEVIPRPYWSAPPDPTDPLQVIARGAVLVRVRGRVDSSSIASPKALPPEIVAALAEPPARPLMAVVDALRADGLLALISIVLSLAVTGLAVAIEALLLRALLEMAPRLGTSGQRLSAIALVIGFGLLLLVLDLPILLGVLRFGRRLETRLRVLYQEKIPQLADRYFHSRLTSDMAERNHSLYLMRLFPVLGEQLVRNLSELVFLVAGIIWIDPRSAPLAIAAAGVGLALPLLTQPILVERDLRVRTNVGGLSRFYLDALLGLVPIRTHGAERAFRREHEALLSEWARSRLSLQGAVVLLDGLQMFAVFGLATALLLSFLARGGDMGPVLLLAYWALRLPFLGQEVAQVAWNYPALRNVALRMLEPLSAPSETANREAPSPAPAGPLGIQFEDLTVRAGGHLILEDVNLTIEPGSHVAVVGASGAGKSSLVGVLLGWHRPSSGRVLVDGKVLDGDVLARVRQETAWVDPAVHIWNESLIANLRYGGSLDSRSPLTEVIDIAELRSVLEGLPDGYQTSLGEGGGLVSGGEGQRVRFGRALLRSGVRLVILDEPFRGLDGGTRSLLLERARRFWKDRTLLCITHDVQETLAFDRVIVVERGRIREDGPPQTLRATSSAYRTLLETEAGLKRLWSDGVFRRLALSRGKLSELPRPQGP